MEVRALHLDVSSMTNEDVQQQCKTWPEIRELLVGSEIIDVRIKNHENLCASVFIKTKTPKNGESAGKLNGEVMPEKESCEIR